MSGRPARYVAVYDISDDRERRTVSKILEGFGMRVQESVFECLLTSRLKSALKYRLEKATIETGSVLIYRMSEGSPRMSVGQAVPEPDRMVAYIV